MVLRNLFAGQEERQRPRERTVDTVGKETVGGAETVVLTYTQHHV